VGAGCWLRGREDCALVAAAGRVAGLLPVFTLCNRSFD